MEVTLNARKEILRELRKMSCGSKTELVSSLKRLDLSSKTIDDVCEELGLVGVIRHGYDGLGELRFKLTDFGEDYCDSFLSFSDTKQGLAKLVEYLLIVENLLGKI